MIRWLLIALFIFIIIRLLRGPGKKRRSSIRFHFGNINSRNGRRGANKPRLEDIEEAEYEDITEPMNKENDQ